MKQVLWISVLLNVALILSIAWNFATRPTKQQQVELLETMEPAAEIPEPATDLQPVIQFIPDKTFHWDQLRSADLRLYRDRLRAVGCPELTVRDIIIAEIDERFRARRNEIMAQFQPQFWLLAIQGEASIREQWGQQLASISAERQAMILDLLGERSVPDTENDASQIASDESSDQSDGELLKSRESLWAAALAGFEPTEAEWRAVTKLRIDCEQAQKQLDDSDATDSEKLARSEQLRADLEREIAAVLGPGRFAEYRLAEDGGFQEIYRVTSRYGLSGSVAREANAIRMAALEELEKLKARQQQDRSSVETVSAAISRETKDALKRVLGSRAFATYEEYSGSWMESLE